jgi:hypothetical protein
MCQQNWWFFSLKSRPRRDPVTFTVEDYYWCFVAEQACLAKLFELGEAFKKNNPCPSMLHKSLKCLQISDCNQKPFALLPRYAVLLTHQQNCLGWKFRPQ